MSIPTCHAGDWGSIPQEGARNFPGGAVVKNLPANAVNARDVGLIPGSGRKELPCLPVSHDPSQTSSLLGFLLNNVKANYTLAYLHNLLFHKVMCIKVFF